MLQSPLIHQSLYVLIKIDKRKKAKIGVSFYAIFLSKENPIELDINFRDSLGNRFERVQQNQNNFLKQRNQPCAWW